MANKYFDDPNKWGAPITPKIQRPNPWKPRDSEMGFGGRQTPHEDFMFGKSEKSDSAGLITNPLQEDGGVGGDWMGKAEFGLGVADFGLNVYNAFQTAKMNDFMRDYYSDIMDMNRADFANSAKDANRQMEQQQIRRLDAQGVLAGTEANQQQTAEYMNEWAVKESYA